MKHRDWIYSVCLCTNLKGS